MQQNLICPLPYSRCLCSLTGWVMRCVQSLAVQGPLVRHQVPQVHHSDRDGITRKSSASAAGIWDTHRPGVPNQIHLSHSDRMVGTHSLMVHDDALMDHNRETTYRPGPHPLRSTRDSFGPQLILIIHNNKFF